jgi:hypothetical protein
MDEARIPRKNTIDTVARKRSQPVHGFLEINSLIDIG